MRVLLILLLMVIPASVTAKEYFSNKDLKELRVVSIHGDKALIRGDGKKAEISVGDTLGKDRRKVIEVESTHITLEGDRVRTRIPVIAGFER